MLELNYEVHAIIGNTDVTNIPAGFNKIKFYPFDFSYTKCYKRLEIYRNLIFVNKDLAGLISKIMDNNTIDAAFIDYYFFGQYISLFSKRNIPVIYGTHNAQAVLIKQQPAVSFKNSLAKIADYIVNRFHECWFFRKANALIVVSGDDKKYHAGFIKKTKIFVIPNFLIQSDYKPVDGDKENYVLMTANFKAFQNIFGIEWFIREVWDQELAQKTRLVLVGLGSKEVFEKIRGKQETPGITALGEVDDLKPYIIRAKVSIVPLLHGSGSRLKCLESMALKTQLISTSKGAEGIEHDHSVLLADTPADFKQAILKVINNQIDHTEKAYQCFVNKYSVEPNKKIFASIIGTIVKNNMND